MRPQILHRHHQYTSRQKRPGTTRHFVSPLTFTRRPRGCDQPPRTSFTTWGIAISNLGNRDWPHCIITALFSLILPILKPFRISDSSKLKLALLEPLHPIIKSGSAPSPGTPMQPVLHSASGAWFFLPSVCYRFVASESSFALSSCLELSLESEQELVSFIIQLRVDPVHGTGRLS